MNHTRILAAAAAVASLAACSTGAPSGEREERFASTRSALTTPNQICADWSPYQPNVNWYCENTQDTGHVYQVARQKAGNQAGTITVWVLWPIDEGQEDDPSKINGWFDQANRVMAWLKGQSDLDLFDRSVKSLQNGLANRLYGSQQRLLNAKKGAINDAVTAVQNKVNAQANDPQKAALAVALSDTKIKLEALGQSLAMARDALTALQPVYLALVNDFKAYRATESDVIAKLTGFANAASAADATKLAAIKVAVADYERQVFSDSSDLSARAGDLRARLLAVQAQYEAGLDPYADFLAARGLSEAKLADGALRAVGNMMAYFQARQTAIDAAIAKLNDGIRARSDALFELAVDQATRDTLANARFADASTAFVNDANARIAKLWAAPPTSPNLKYPLYSAQYDAFVAFSQLEPMCSQSALAASSYMKAGCGVLQPSFDRARAWLKDTLPGALRMRLILLRRKKADENLCKQVEAALAAGNLKAAAAAYDTALNLLDPPGVQQ